MKSTIQQPKSFISYSWSSPEHEQWVIQLATELRESGVDVILDKWDLKEGNDAYAFMEKMVNDPDIKKVILICDKRYTDKANGRSGGVGTETQIISAEVYMKQDQDKFVAILSERDEQGRPFLPTYYKSRIYIDLSTDDQYARNFENLLRWIYDKPLYIKPDLGPAPSFLKESGSVSLGTGARFKRAVDAIRNGKAYTRGALNEYFDSVVLGFEKLRIKDTSGEFDEKVVESISLFLPHRNELIEVFLCIAQYQNTRETQQSLHRFFEGLIPFMSRKESDFDNLKFVIHELYIYCIAALLKYECFDAVSSLLKTKYFVSGNTDFGWNSLQGFEVFRPYLESLDYRNKRLDLRRLSVHADLLKERCVATGMSFEQIMQADFVLYLRDCFDQLRDDSTGNWWPVTLLFKTSYRGSTFEIFARASSTTYFDQLKVVFDIQKKDEIMSIFDAYKDGKLQIPRWTFHQFDPKGLVGYDGLASRP